MVLLVLLERASDRPVQVEVLIELIQRLGSIATLQKCVARMCSWTWASRTRGRLDAVQAKESAQLRVLLNSTTKVVHFSPVEMASIPHILFGFRCASVYSASEFGPDGHSDPSNTTLLDFQRRPSSLSLGHALC